MKSATTAGRVSRPKNDHRAADGFNRADKRAEEIRIRDADVGESARGLRDRIKKFENAFIKEHSADHEADQHVHVRAGWRQHFFHQTHDFAPFHLHPENGNGLEDFGIGVQSNPYRHLRGGFHSPAVNGRAIVTP